MDRRFHHHCPFDAIADERLQLQQLCVLGARPRRLRITDLHLEHPLPMGRSAVSALQGYMKMNKHWDIHGTLTSLRFTCHGYYLYKQVHLCSAHRIMMQSADAAAAVAAAAAAAGVGRSGRDGLHLHASHDDLPRTGSACGHVDTSHVCKCCWVSLEQTTHH